MCWVDVAVVLGEELACVIICVGEVGCLNTETEKISNSR